MYETLTTYELRGCVCTAAFLKEPSEYGKYSLRILFAPALEGFGIIEEALEEELVNLGLDIEAATWPVSDFALNLLNEMREDAVVEGEPTIKLTTKDQCFDDSILIGDKIDVRFQMIPYDFEG